MAMNPRLELRTTQRLALTPTVRTGLSVLRMTALDLVEEITREAARNPFLLVEKPGVPVAQAPPSADGPPDMTAPTGGFQEELRRQLGRIVLPAPIAALADLLVGELRDDGFLDVSLDVLAEELGLPMGPLAQALDAVQSCDPPGIGARDLAECLRLQLTEKGLSDAEARATVAHLAAFAARDWAGLEQALGLPPAALRERADLLRGLSPRPVAESAAAPVSTLRPDLRLERGGNGVLSITLEERARPHVRLDEALVLRAEADGFAPELLIRAKALIAAIDQRGQTLRRIGDWLIQHQSGFFTDGPAALAPASRVSLAADLALHPSTISRAVSGKAVDVDGRLWPLSVFFSSAIAGASGAVSARGVQHRLAEMIAAEPADHPLSDETLVSNLRAEGVDIARRTVAKYRQGLRIPSSSARRRLAAAKRDAHRRPKQRE